MKILNRFEELRRTFLPRFYDTKNKVMIYPEISGYGIIVYKIVKADGSLDFLQLPDLIFDPRFIMMRPTGWEDKDGKLIYDRDIVKYINKATAEQFSHDMIGIIEWKATGFAITPIGAGFCGWLTQIPRGKNSFEIIGNIHENPELMEDV